MDAILVVNAGSSSIKFQIFEIGSDGEPRRLVKGQMDGIGSRPRLRAEANDDSSLINKEFEPKEIPDVPAAMTAVGDWLRATQSLVLVGVGGRPCF
jgi:acetate kinase